LKNNKRRIFSLSNTRYNISACFSLSNQKESCNYSNYSKSIEVTCFAESQCASALPACYVLIFAFFIILRYFSCFCFLIILSFWSYIFIYFIQLLTMQQRFCICFTLSIVFVYSFVSFVLAILCNLTYKIETSTICSRASNSLFVNSLICWQFIA